MRTVCSACQAKPSVTRADYAPMCADCLYRAGQGIEPGARVVCDLDPDGDLSGVVVSMKGKHLALVQNERGDAYLPVVELIQVIADEVVTVAD